MVVGDGKDPHVQSVVERFPGAGLVVIDAEHLTSVVARLDDAMTTLVDVIGNLLTVAPTVRCGVGYGD